MADERNEDVLGELGARLGRSLVAWRHRRRRRVATSFATVLALGLTAPVVAGGRASEPAGSAPRGGGETTTTRPVAVETVRVPPTVAATPPIAPVPGPVPDPASTAVLVDHERWLPPGWVPSSLVDAPIPFVFDGPSPKRQLRADAAAALADLVAAARRDGAEVIGVSGYRSEQRQAEIYAGYVRSMGQAAADRVSAKPGHSEHQTGLAIDVTGTDPRCQVSACFADTPQARWLAAHAHRYGWIVRYPAGAEHITGYQAEPWHLRYVGRTMAAQLRHRGITLDELVGAR